MAKSVKNQLQEAIEAVKVGGSFSTPMTMDNSPQQPVVLHCTEATLFPHPVKQFSVLARGVVITTVAAMKVEGESTWQMV